ncbi:MAG: glycosyltransferase [Anaerolineae bacterium]|nr:glycosyltransferase [Anaerolineae bacterium]
MRILFLSQVLPYPLDAGPKMRSYFVLRHLTQQHEVTLLTFVRDTDRPENIAHLAEFCHAVRAVPMRRSRFRDLKFLIQGLLTQQPFLIIRDELPEMIDALKQLVGAQSFDAIHADQLWMAQYALAAGAMLPQAKLLLDQHNAVYLIPKRLAESTANPLKQLFLSRESRALAAFEAEVCHRFDHVVWVTGEDYQAVAALAQAQTNGLAPSTIIPICADPGQVKPVTRASGQKRITFLGGLHWPPNAEGILWFAKQVFPRVRTEIPEAILTVIGKNPPAGLAGEGVEATGYVTDLSPYLAETTVFIVPLHAGGGMRVKILDAWSWGLPIVSTTIGAEGIDIQPGQNILIADTVPDFAQAVIRVLQEPALAQQLAQEGRQTVRQKYDWRRIYPAWDKIYAGLANNGSGTQG